MIEDAEIRLRYHAKAQQFLYGRARLDEATQDEVDKVADYLRYQDFRLAIEPYLKMKERAISPFLMLSVSPGKVELPRQVKEAIAQCDEMIAIEARKFGYTPDQP